MRSQGYWKLIKVHKVPEVTPRELKLIKVPEVPEVTLRELICQLPIPRKTHINCPS